MGKLRILFLLIWFREQEEGKRRITEECKTGKVKEK
jgi:hypothetical protein